MAPPTSAGPGKSPRPVLPSHVAHAHAFATVPSPGVLKSVSSAYFPLPTPPAPLRTFALAPSEAISSVDGSTSYQTSTKGQGRPARIDTNSGEKLQEVTNYASSSKAARQELDGPPKSPFARPPSTGSHYQFAAVPFATRTPTRSSGFSSSSSASGRSALSIAEIDCFFVQGSRSSAYSAARSNSSSQSRPPSEAGGSASLSELGLSSNEEVESGEVWVSDEAERERQREERKAFMKARQNLREEARRKKRKSNGGQVDDAHTATWREVIQTRATIPLKGIPESRAGSSRGASASSSPRGIQCATQPAEPLADILRAPLPSGPGPPPATEPAAVDTLVETLTGSMAISESVPEEKSDQDSTPPADGMPPTLSRFDSGDTEVGIPAIVSPVD